MQQADLTNLEIPQEKKSRFRDVLKMEGKRLYGKSTYIKPVIEYSFDDGLKEDLIIVDLLRKYKVKNAIFYIPSNTALTPTEIRDISKDFEIGGHTVSHFQDLKLLDRDILKLEIEDNKKWLEDTIGKKITKFCYPRGRWNARVKKAVIDAGFTEARTTVVLKTSFGGFNKDTSVHFYPRREYVSWHPFSLALCYAMTYKDGEYLRFWGHSKELIDNGYLKEFEDLLSVLNDL